MRLFIFCQSATSSAARMIFSTALLHVYANCSRLLLHAFIHLLSECNFVSSSHDFFNQSFIGFISFASSSHDFQEVTALLHVYANCSRLLLHAFILLLSECNFVGSLHDFFNQTCWSSSSSHSFIRFISFAGSSHSIFTQTCSSSCHHIDSEENSREDGQIHHEMICLKKKEKKRKEK